MYEMDWYLYMDFLISHHFTALRSDEIESTGSLFLPLSGIHAYMIAGSTTQDVACSIEALQIMKNVVYWISSAKCMVAEAFIK